MLKIAVVMELHWTFNRHFEIYAGIKEYSEEYRHFQLEIISYPDQELERGKKFDGIIGRISKNCHTAALKANVPMVNVWIDSPVVNRIPGVCVDYRAAGRLSAEHLITRGFKNLAHLGYKDSEASRVHCEGMQEIARKRDCQFSSYEIPTGFAEDEKLWENFVEYITEIQAQWHAPLGLGFPFDEIAHPVATICIANHWKIPDELALIGANNETLICNAASPSLSSIDLSYRRCGYEAARLLDHLLNGGKAPDEPIYVPPKELVLRRSSDAYAVSDPLLTKALTYMSQNSHFKITVDDIAKSAGIGRQSLEHRFRKQLQRTVNSELIRLRVSKMKRLLIETEKTVGEISDQAGFSTTANMHVMFKRHTGLTPISYRETYGSRL